MQHNSLMPTPECGGGLQVLRDPIDTIKTVGYPQNTYPINTNCLWRVECPSPSQRVATNFPGTFRVAGRMPDCTKDQLRITDCGGATTYGPFCHLRAPQPITSQCSAVEVSFITGDGCGSTRTGFQLNYACVLQ